MRSQPPPTSRLGLQSARAASYPDRPIKIIVPFAPAGPTDIMAESPAQNLGAAIGGNIITENRSGAGGNIGIGYVAHAEPDGYTLLVSSSAYVVNPGLYAKVPYDPYKDFAPIAELGTSPNVILIDPKLGINSIAELIARAKAHPDELNYASPGIGTTPHLSGELLKIAAGINITHVPFSGAAPAIQALLGGVTQMAVAALPPAHPYIESGALKALATTGAHRWFDLKDVPTMVELGYKDFIADTFQAFLAPVKTPPEIVAKLVGEIGRGAEEARHRRAVARQRFRSHRQRLGRLAPAHRGRSAEMARHHRQSRHQAGVTRALLR